jgi:hypothetical protein
MKGLVANQILVNGLCTNGIGQAAISLIFSNNTLFTLSEKFMGETSKNVFIQGASPHFFCCLSTFFCILVKERTGYAFFVLGSF